MTDVSAKVTPDHLRRKAMVYIRQSTMRQVLENTESTHRQYALPQRAESLGWRPDQIEVIDGDLGISAATVVDREGFQKLVAEVSLGKVGIVMGLEVSRLARNCADWHRLLEICGFSHTLILDADGVYDPTQFNDRLLLNLKGTMSEAELHVLKSRLRGGILSKAKRGELRVWLPVGLAYDEEGKVVLDPDTQIQEALRLFFATYEQLGSCCATVKAFRERQILVPFRTSGDAWDSPVRWGPMRLHWAQLALKNPRYAGVAFYGRTRQRTLPDGKKKIEVLPREQWHAFQLEAHEGYITWEQFQANQETLKRHRKVGPEEERLTEAREGRGLLQGLILCGQCGAPMQTRYPRNQAVVYVCAPLRGPEGPCCQTISGSQLDEAFSRLVVASVTPAALEQALAVREEVMRRIEEAQRLLYRQVERAQYEAEKAQQRYMKVDCDNRLVAGTLEKEWNVKLEALAAARETYERQCRDQQLALTNQQRTDILRLAEDFPRLWNDSATPARERKRLLRLLIEDITLTKIERTVTAQVRFRGGATTTLPVGLQHVVTPPASVARIREWLPVHGLPETVRKLNEAGLRSASGNPFNLRMVGAIADRERIPKDRYEELRKAGKWTLAEIANHLGASVQTVYKWRKAGLLPAHQTHRNGEFLFDPPNLDAPRPHKGKRLQSRSTRQETALIAQEV